MTISCTSLIKKHLDLFHQATHPKFLQECKNNIITQDHFSQWLVQNYHFIHHLADFQQSLLLDCPKSDKAFIQELNLGLEEEKPWFKNLLSSRNITPEHFELNPVWREYAEVLKANSRLNYTLKILAI